MSKEEEKSELQKIYNELDDKIRIEISHMEYELKKAKEEIINKYQPNIDNYTNQKEFIKEKIDMYNEKMISFATFDAYVLKKILVLLISAFEKKEYSFEDRKPDFFTGLIISYIKPSSIKQPHKSKNCIVLASKNNKICYYNPINNSSDIFIPRKYFYVNGFLMELIENRCKNEKKHMDETEIFYFLNKFLAENQDMLVNVDVELEKNRVYQKSKVENKKSFN